MKPRIESYFAVLGSIGGQLETTDSQGKPMDVSEAVDWAVAQARSTHANGCKLMFVGNGGSAAIASHMATDYSKNGGMRSLSFNDGANLTCLSNDLGYENVFSFQVGMHGRKGDFLIAISSSGNSANILNAVKKSKEMDITVMTLSGFKPDNKLRLLGDVNFYIPNDEYGFVEIGHLTICHAVLDFSLGWDPEQKSGIT